MKPAWLSSRGPVSRYNKAMTGPLAVIDLGTNTFHLLIAERDPSRGFRIIHRHRRYVHLGRGGLERLDEDAMQVGLEVCRQFRKSLDAYDVSTCRVLGTEALRRAENALAFMERLAEILGHPVERIDGLVEAGLIAAGVRLLLPRRFPPALIMDIGGGSVEFIRMEKGDIRWRASFPCGVSVLHRRFHRTDPISPADTRSMEDFLDELLQPLWLSQQGLEVPALIGAAGIYEVLARHAASGQEGGLRRLDLPSFFRFAGTAMNLDLEGRMAHPAIPRERAELLPSGLVLIRWVIRRLEVIRLYASPYAMKEGALAEMLHNPA